MPSAINDESRYNNSDREQHPSSNGATFGDRTTDVSDGNDLIGDKDLVYKKSPISEGCEPGSSQVQTIPPLISLVDDSTDSLAQNNTIPKSIDDGQPLAQDGDNVISYTNTDEDCDSSRHGFQQPETTNVPSSSHDDDNFNNHRSNASIDRDRDHTRDRSGSPHRIVNKLNSIVTRISRVLANLPISRLSTSRFSLEEPPKFEFCNRRALERTWKLMDKVVKLCQDTRMKLNNSPPFILDILPETYKHVKLIHAKYELRQINDDDYSQIFLRNLQNRCELTLKLFKDAKDDIYNEESDYRHKLTRNTLVFNHILSELKAIFPNGSFIGDKYLITKKETAGEFWKSNFGDSIIVDWKTFYHALQQVHSIDSSFFSLHALKQTIDLTCDDHISIFEFDVFTRLFQPWSTLLKNWQTLAVTHPGYKAFLTYDELKTRLQQHIDKPGSYEFRLSCTRLGQWVIGYVTQDGQILQTIVQNISLRQALTETEFYLYPDGKEVDPELRERLLSGMTDDERNVTVTEEQYEIYCGIGNSFQTCKICFVNDKEIRIEPCNHLLCTSCLLTWQESDGQGCPYCRTEIKETVQITMDLPQKPGQSE